MNAKRAGDVLVEKRALARRKAVLRVLSNTGFSLLAAVLIWAGVGARITTTRTFTMRLRLDAPPGVECELRGGPQLMVEVTLEGPAEVLDSLSAENLERDDLRLRAKVDITREELDGRMRLGETFELNPSRDVEVPDRLITRLRAVACRPASVRLDLSPIVTREYPVEVPLRGRPRQGDFVIEAPRAEPTRVALTGSLKVLLQYEADRAHRDRQDRVIVKAEAVALSEAYGTIERLSELQLPEGLSAEPARVRVTVPLRQSEDYEVRSFELDLRFLVPPGLPRGYIFEARPPRKTVLLRFAGRKAMLLDFERRLVSPDRSRRPYLYVRVPEGVEPVPQIGEIELGNFDPEGLIIRDDKSFLYNVRAAPETR